MTCYKRIVMNCVLWTGVAVYAAGCAAPGNGVASRPIAPMDTGIGHQVGSTAGAHIGGEYGFLGSTIGGLVGSQAERGVANAAVTASEGR